MKPLFYAIRWQLSSPVLAIVLVLLSNLPIWWSVIIANLAGAIIFYPVDEYIFKKEKK